MPPERTRKRMKSQSSIKSPTISQVDQSRPSSSTKETKVTVSKDLATPLTSPSDPSQASSASRKAQRLRCTACDDHPLGFRSEHELRRHTNRVHQKTRKVWVTVDTSPDKTFLANCKACQTGKRYNECYNAASHLRRMHFHPHKRGERKMTAAEARRGGKPGDLDPPMDVLKEKWLREVEEDVREGDERPFSRDVNDSFMNQKSPIKPAKVMEVNAPRTKTTSSTRSMAITSIVDMVDAS